MSRCFPYPPPGYSLSRATNEALIESIKLQKEKEKAKEHHKEKSKEQKEKRREKKEKKREKKEKRKDKKDKVLDLKLPKSHVGKSDNGEKVFGDLKAQFLLKKREAEAEQLERSSLTDERGQPVTLAVPSTSSDSTQNSNKRKRDPSPSDVSRGSGNIIRIRLSSKKPKSDAPPANEQQPCSEPRRADLPVQNEDENRLGDLNGFLSTLNRDANVEQPFASRCDIELICSTSQQQQQPIEVAAPVKPRKLTSAQKEELRYENLFENWSPPKLQDECLEPDLDWLLQGRKSDLIAEKKWRTGIDEISCSNSAVMQPRARYLKEADIYALPFTVPF